MKQKKRKFISKKSKHKVLPEKICWKILKVKGGNETLLASEQKGNEICVKVLESSGL
jgi:hypothetical protein